MAGYEYAEDIYSVFNFAVGILQFVASCGPVSVDYTYPFLGVPIS